MMVQNLLFLMFLFVFAACNSGGGGSPTSGGGTPSETIPSGPTYNVSGTITYDFIPTYANGLNYVGKTQKPVRNVKIQARNASGNGLVANGTTDDSGNFTITVPQSVTSYYINVISQMASPSITIEDNTNNNAVYLVRDNNRSNSGDVTGITINLPSGWTGSNSTGSYSAPRYSAPFAILDTIYSGYKKILAERSDLNLPALKVNWSVNNIASSDYNVASGHIGTSHFDGDELYILGKLNNDTDEHDQHVIVHEWGHFVEAFESRSDSLGGQHGYGDKLNISLAFGEGWGNALSAIILDPLTTYRDSMGPRQQVMGIEMDIEGGSDNPKGWFSETSVQQIIFDIYDPGNEAADSVSLGIGPIIDVLRGPQKTTPALTSIFSFIDGLKSLNPGSATAINTLLTNKNISNVQNVYGQGETNDGGDAHSLPVYNTLSVGGATINRTIGGGNYRYNVMNNNRYYNFQATAATTRLDLTCNDYCEIGVFKQGQVIKTGYTYSSVTLSFSTVAGQWYSVLVLSDEDYTNGTATINSSLRAY